MAVSQAHRDYLRAQAIGDTFIDAVCDTEPDGMVFNFVGPTGRVAKQKRLDNPPDSGSRFVGPAGVPSVMRCRRAMMPSSATTRFHCYWSRGRRASSRHPDHRRIRTTSPQLGAPLRTPGEK